MKILHNYEDIQNKKILFFDLDGTLITTAKNLKEKPFAEDITDFRIKKKVLDVISSLRKAEYLFIVSNQAGIPQYYSKEEFDVKFNTILNFIKNYIYLYKNNIIIKGMYCTAKGSNAKNRKPNTGMLERSLKGLDYSKEEMLMIGDASGIHNEHRDDFSDSDLRTARNFSIDYMDIEDFEHIINSKTVNNC